MFYKTLKMGDTGTARLIDSNNNRRDGVNLADFSTTVTAKGAVVQMASGKPTDNNNNDVIGPTASPNQASTRFRHVKDLMKILPPVILITQLLVVLALFTEIWMFWKNLQWDQAMEGLTTINFPSPGSLSTPDLRYLSVDDGGDQLWKHLLARDLTPSIQIIIVLCIIGTFNFFAAKYTQRPPILPYLAGFNFLFGIVTLLMAVYQRNVTLAYIATNYRAMLASLKNYAIPPHYLVPDEPPFTDPVRVRGNVAYFYQVFNSCRNGNIESWDRANYLRGLEHRFPVPSYRQLANAGFCVESWFTLCPFLILLLLVCQCWAIAMLCAVIKKRQSIVVAEFGMEERGSTESSSGEQTESPKKLTRKFKNAGSDLMQFRV